ncbi:MAG: dihydrofolate reductase [Bacteroidales bacterium]|nr:dihydrofolate reductase [Bacteroidales bacterium]
MLCVCGLGLVAASCSQESPSNEEPFKYTADEFADLQILKYRIPGWESLTLQQKAYIYHLSEAGKCGRDILFNQNFKYNLGIRKLLERIIKGYQGDKECEQWQQLLVYAKRVFFSNGIHHHYAEDKIIPGCTMEYFKGVMDEMKMENTVYQYIPIIFDPELYPQRKYTGTGKDIIEASAVNFYGEGITKDEVNSFYAAMEDPNDTTPLAYGINSRLVKKDGKLVEEVYRQGGRYSNSITAITLHLEKAAQFAENDAQKDYIAKLIEYYRTGSLEAWDEYNIAWVQENSGQVDFINGFIEDYNDPLGRKATWESSVNFKDTEASRRTQLISDNAQWFEDNSPIRDEFKKKEVKGVTAKVINVACIGGDCFPATPIGINLPNSNWIRKEYGSKSVTIANITDAYNRAAEESPRSITNEFSWSDTEKELIKKYGNLTGNLHTDLHECLGHGSGQLLPGVSPTALGEYNSTLEEARADLFGLYYIADKKLVELGILPDEEAYKSEYINFIMNGLFTQFVRIELGKTNTEAHMQDRKLIAEWCYENGLKEKTGAGKDVIEKVVKEGKTYFVINDYQALRGLFGKLLAEVQRIKSEGDYKAGKELVEKYAVHIDPALHKEVKERYASLELKPYKGFINPTIGPVLDKKGSIADYKITYNDDFLAQMLEYGEKYSFESSMLR